MPCEMTPQTDNFASLRRGAPAWLEYYRFGLRVTERGTILSIGDGIAHISGLPSASMDEILQFEDGSRAVVFSLEEDFISAVLLEDGPALTAGAGAYLSGHRLSIPTGDELIGRVIDPLGMPLDGGPAPDCAWQGDLEAQSPRIVAREFVEEPLYTGNKIVDTLIPIGKGQRQLLIGDNGLGKSSFALDTVINQKGKNVSCVYVLIGQKRSTVVSTVETLREAGALEHCTVVVAEATTTPGLKYLAPFAGCAVAEAWMAQGKDTLIVYDDLTTHAQAYRELSLLLRRPPGREAYPGDIFYLHSRLLERSAHLAATQGGGSMTALPIVETREGEIAAYIPTNLISITDGQIYFDASLFAGGFLPAIDVRTSVSRIGGKAQHAAYRPRSRAHETRLSAVSRAGSLHALRRAAGGLRRGQNQARAAAPRTAQAGSSIPAIRGVSNGLARCVQRRPVRCAGSRERYSGCARPPRGRSGKSRFAARRESRTLEASGRGLAGRGAA